MQRDQIGIEVEIKVDRQHRTDFTAFKWIRFDSNVISDCTASRGLAATASADNRRKDSKLNRSKGWGVARRRSVLTISVLLRTLNHSNMRFSASDHFPASIASVI